MTDESLRGRNSIERWHDLLRAVQYVFQLILFCILLLYLVDYLMAKDAIACSAPEWTTAQSCFPWGPSPVGPIEGAWNFQSKEIYLGASRASIIVALSAFIVPLFISHILIRIVLMVLIFVVGLSQMQWLARLL